MDKDGRQDERRLVRRLKRRDERAFTDFVGQYQAQVYGLTYRLLGNHTEAEDLTQEVFVTVFKKIDGFRGDASLRTWVLKIARNHARSRLRFRRVRHFREHDSWQDVDAGSTSDRTRVPDPADKAVADELSQVARDQFLELSEAAREVLTLYDLNGLKYDEIAEILAVQIGTVRSRLFRARREWHTAIHKALAEPTDESSR